MLMIYSWDKQIRSQALHVLPLSFKGRMRGRRNWSGGCSKEQWLLPRRKAREVKEVRGALLCFSKLPCICWPACGGGMCVCMFPLEANEKRCKWTLFHLKAMQFHLICIWLFLQISWWWGWGQSLPQNARQICKEAEQGSWGSFAH